MVNVGCGKCKKLITSGAKNIIDVSVYSKIDINENTGDAEGGTNEKQILYHKKCFPKELLDV